MKVDNPSSGIFSLSFLNEHRGIAVGGDYLSQDSHPHSNIVMTVDGGRTWENLNIPALAGRYLSSVTWLSNQRVLVVDGSQGTFHSVAAQGKQGWAVGPNGNCAKF